VDIFRERVYLRSDGNESRIIPLVQLKLEMADAESTGVAVASAPQRAAQERPEREPGEAAPDTDAPGGAPERRRRRRRRRDRRQDEP
jgi:hypothetical protein